MTAAAATTTTRLKVFAIIESESGLICVENGSSPPLVQDHQQTLNELQNKVQLKFVQEEIHRETFQQFLVGH